MSIFFHVQNEIQRLSKRVLRGFGLQEHEYGQRGEHCMKICIPTTRINITEEKSLLCAFLKSVNNTVVYSWSRISPKSPIMPFSRNHE